MNKYDYVKAWRTRMRMRLVEAFGGKCGICEYKRCNNALEFHHLDPKEKSFNLGSSNIANWSKIVDEAQKCVMLCCICHREVHAGLIEVPIEIARFNSDYIEWPVNSRPTDKCPICGVDKHIGHKYCSSKCAAIGKQKVDWVQYNLSELLEIYNYTQIGNMVGVTGNAVKKRAVKLGIR